MSGRHTLAFSLPCDQVLAPNHKIAFYPASSDIDIHTATDHIRSVQAHHAKPRGSAGEEQEPPRPILPSNSLGQRCSQNAGEPNEERLSPYVHVEVRLEGYRSTLTVIVDKSAAHGCSPFESYPFPATVWWKGVSN